MMDRRVITGAVALLSLLPLPKVHALQPLSDFVQGARAYSPQNTTAGAVAEQRAHEARAAKWRLGPTLTASVSYTRNQYERRLALPGATSSPAFVRQDQLDAQVAVRVPLIDVGAWERTQVARTSSLAAEAQADLADLSVEQGVTRAYYQLLADEAVVASAQRALELSQSHEETVRQRADAGVATQLEVQRARADVARAQQDLTAAELRRTLSRRRLSSLTGMQPTRTAEFPEDDLASEAPLERWLQTSQDIPALRVARETAKAADSSEDAALAAYYPTLSFEARERYSNATALVGHPAAYALMFTAAWQLSGSTVHEARAQRAAAKAASARAAQQAIDSQDAIFEAWQRVSSGIERARASRVQAEAAEEAANLARERYVGGVATQLDVLDANTQAFHAQVARIQADADLTYARAALRLAAGVPTSGETP